MISFSGVEAFCDELERDRELVDREIVRIAFQTRHVNTVISTQYLIATARVAGDVVRLDCMLGDDFGPGADEAIAERAEKAEAAIEALGFEIRRGGVLS